MADKETASTDAPIDLARVLSEELKHNRPDAKDPKDRNLASVFKKLHEAHLTALCFSGGGIRSATFGLGIIQALAKHKLLTRFDYLSTVSGGGYLGSWLSAWVYRAAPMDKKTGEKMKAEDEAEIEPIDLGIHRVQTIINCRPIKGGEKPNPEPTQLQHLREFSNYMSPKTGLLSIDKWTLGTIYLRNLALSLLIFIPLLAAVLMIPRLLYRSVGQRDYGQAVQFVMLFAAMIAGGWAVGFVIGRLPSKISKSKEEAVTDERATLWQRIVAFSNTDAGVMAFGVLPLVVAAFLTSTLWAWVHRGTSSLNSLDLGSNSIDLAALSQLAFVMLVVVVAFLIGVIIFWLSHPGQKVGWWIVIAALFSSLLGGVLLWFTTEKIFPQIADLIRNLFDNSAPLMWPIYLCFAVPTLLMIVLISATIFVGLTSRKMTDEDREWLARFGALVLNASALWLVVNAVVLLGPRALEWILSLDSNTDYRPSFTNVSAILSAITAVVSAVISLGGGFSGRSKAKLKVSAEGTKTWTATFLEIAPSVAAVVFLVMILIVISYLSSLLLHVLWTGMAGITDHLSVLGEVRFAFVLAVLLGLGLIGLLMACFVNVNKFSLHGAYRDRLVRAYLGASNKDRKQDTFTGFDDADNLELHVLRKQRPLHVLNATVNLVGGKTLAWQDRKAASFTMSPLHCGSWAVKGYRDSNGYCVGGSSKKSLRLGTAMAISGAAANPNMGYYSSSIVTFLMAMANIRLGWWLGNTGKPGSARDLIFWNRQEFYKKESPSIAIWPLVNETFGRTDEDKHFLNVSDGGHFENLALYEMVLRRCKFILLSDGAADADFKFGEIANAIQKCKVDLGVDIQFLGSMGIRSRNAPEDEDVKNARFAIALITYPERDENDESYYGWLLYTRPTYYGKQEPRDIQHYAEANAKFPHQSTGDQMYDEKQFEAYRGLGFLTINEIIGMRKRRAPVGLSSIIEDEVRELAGNNEELLRIIDYAFRETEIQNEGDSAVDGEGKPAPKS